MQAYCLSKFLGEPIIDFTYPKKIAAINNLCKKPGDFSCLNWSEEKLPMTKRFNSEDEALEFINSQDYIVIGSDEVWKYTKNNSLNFSCHFPNVYFGHNIRCKKIAYAASIGHKSYLTSDEIGYLDKFDLLSVRDRFTYEAINKISSEIARRTVLISDPTFSIEFFNLKKQEKKGEMWLESDPEHLDSLLNYPLNPIQWFEAVAKLKRAKTRRMHGLIACILGNTPATVICDRPKVKELFEFFSMNNEWPDQKTLNLKIKEYRKQHEQFRRSIEVLVNKNRQSGKGINTMFC